MVLLSYYWNYLEIRHALTLGCIKGINKSEKKLNCYYFEDSFEHWETEFLGNST